MRTFLFGAAILMIGASIYGFVDYRKNSHQKEFKKLYTEPAKTETGTKPTAAVVTPGDKVIAEQKTVAVTASDKPAVNVKKNQAKKKAVKKKRKLDHRIFSRAPLDDEYLEDEIPKEENKPDNQ